MTKHTKKPLQIWHHGMAFERRGRLIPADYRPENRRSMFQCARMVAAPSRAAAARAMGVTSNWLNTWGSEGMNAYGTAVATAEPGVVFWQPLDASMGRGIKGSRTHPFRGPAPWARDGEPWADRDTIGEPGADQ